MRTEIILEEDCGNSGESGKSDFALSIADSKEPQSSQDYIPINL